MTSCFRIGARKVPVIMAAVVFLIAFALLSGTTKAKDVSEEEKGELERSWPVSSSIEEDSSRFLGLGGSSSNEGLPATAVPIQCVTCGVPDFGDSLPKGKTFNVSCHHMLDHAKSDSQKDRFVQTCPPGSAGCYSSHDIYVTTGLKDEPETKVGPESNIWIGYKCTDQHAALDIAYAEGQFSHVTLYSQLCTCAKNMCNQPTKKLLKEITQNFKKKMFGTK